MSTLAIRKTISAFLAALVAGIILLPFSIDALAADEEEPEVQRALGITSSLGKWFAGLVPFVYNSTNAPPDYAADPSIVEDMFDEAIAAWEGYCNILFVYNGIDDTADITDLNDGIAVFEWDAGIGGAAGQAGPAWTTSTLNQFGYWVYVDGSLKMNPDVYDAIGTTPAEIINNRIGFIETAIHELGHLIGLGHSDQPLSIMYANPYNSITHTVEDDIQICRKMYGYPSVHVPLPTYDPPGAGTLTYTQFFLTTGDTFPTPWAGIDDGVTRADTDSVWLVLQQQTANYDDTIVYVLVDPEGHASVAGDSPVMEGDFFGFGGNMTFRRLREIPGMWTLYVYDSTGLQTTFNIDVQATLPVVNNPPSADFSFTDNPATRAVSLTTDVTGDGEGDNATVSWYIPSQGQIDVSPGGANFSDTQNVMFNDSFDWEIWAVVNDDAARYMEDLPNNIGPAGVGHQSLYRYLSSRRNASPDLDGDNSADVVWRNATSGKNWRYAVNGNLIRSSELINVENGPGWEMVGFGDFNGDGKTDILWRNTLTGKNVMYLMDGSTPTIEVVNVEGNQDWKVVGTGDYDGDGKCDILWRNFVTGANHMYLMDGSTISMSLPVNVENDLQWTVVGSGDMNGDGKADILWRHMGNGKNWVYYMDGANVDQSLFINREGKQFWKVVGNGDYNGDGFADIMWRHTLAGGNATGLVWVYLMQGNNIVDSLPVALEPNLNWVIVSNGDFNEDGRSDLMWRNSVSGSNWLFHLSGSSVINSVPLNVEGNTDWEVMDFN